MQQSHCPSFYGVQPQNDNSVVNQNNQQVQHKATQINNQQTQHIGYTPKISNQYDTNPTGLMQSGQHINPEMSQSYQSAATQSYASSQNINRAVPNSYKVQQPGSNQNNQQIQPQAAQMNYQPQQTPKVGYMPFQVGNTSNQHVANSTGLQ